MIDEEFVVEELTGTGLPAVVELCRSALDLPDDAAEAEQIVRRLCPLPAGASTLPQAGASTPGTGGPSDRRIVGFVARSGAPGPRTPPRGVVLASLDHADPALGHIDLVAVLPAARRRGIGRALLGAAERALAGLGAREVALSGNAPHYAWPGIDVRYTPAVCAAQALGYAHESTAWNMTADLSAGSPAVRDTGPAEARLASAGVLVRRATGADRDALAAMIAEHFSPSWVVEVDDSLDRPGAGCHLALRDGKPLAFAAYGSSRPSWFGPMGTAPAGRGLGVGAVLLRRCLTDQRADGHASAQIGWVGPVPFYSGVAAARIERVFFLYRKPIST